MFKNKIPRLIKNNHKVIHFDYKGIKLLKVNRQKKKPKHANSKRKLV